MSYDMKECGNRIRQLRIQKGCTQETLANKLNMDRSLLSHIESGKRGCSVDLLVRFSDFFDVSLDMLVLGRENSMPCMNDNGLLKLKIVDLIDSLEAFKRAL